MLNSLVDPPALYVRSYHYTRPGELGLLQASAAHRQAAGAGHGGRKQDTVYTELYQ